MLVQPQFSLSRLEVAGYEALARFGPYADLPYADGLVKSHLVRMLRRFSSAFAFALRLASPGRSEPPVRPAWLHS